MIPTISILSTKTLAADQRAILRAVPIELIEIDFITISTLDFNIDHLHDYLLLTSQNAVRSLLQHPKGMELKQKPVFCVGIKTKLLLEQNGWEVLAWAHYAVDLAPIIANRYPHVQISFFNGNLRSHVLPEAFQAAQMEFNEFQVYRTDLSSHSITKKLDGICFYSPSGVYSYLKQNTVGEAVCFCIGKTTATALEGITTRVILASHPTVEATLEACVNYYK
ncbi:uroporphyrinogen-III synthase [Flavobacterium sp. NKUCC04_CG]|uniref:uroporphyrinogen-III synthase n=1 Tax=Flavobacterium sp. NKUCC04_CG TaxID=2842121 RepID=UPI001C5A8777|nr:uroporphyrinogen-III synthase [Flavobacterium sp. NKUCC04_CG]MBW3518523.1 uroporphyrinogen-III synthase [Flavobacterium sp. NKUCC04_CG]